MERAALSRVTRIVLFTLRHYQYYAERRFSEQTSAWAISSAAAAAAASCLSDGSVCGLSTSVSVVCGPAHCAIVADMGADMTWKLVT